MPGRVHFLCSSPLAFLNWEGIPKVPSHVIYSREIAMGPKTNLKAQDGKMNSFLPLLTGLFLVKLCFCRQELYRIPGTRTAISMAYSNTWGFGNRSLSAGVLVFPGLLPLSSYQSLRGQISNRNMCFH